MSLTDIFWIGLAVIVISRAGRFLEQYFIDRAYEEQERLKEILNRLDQIIFFLNEMSGKIEEV